MDSLRNLGATVINFAKGHPGLDRFIDPVENSRQAEEAIKYIEKLISSEHFDMLIMDEVLISVRDGFVDQSKVIRFVESKPEHLELVMTGRGATDALIEMADYVSRIEKIKHPFDCGIMSRKGVEY